MCVFFSELDHLTFRGALFGGGQRLLHALFLHGCDMFGFRLQVRQGLMERVLLLLLLCLRFPHCPVFGITMVRRVRVRAVAI